MYILIRCIFLTFHCVWLSALLKLLQSSYSLFAASGQTISLAMCYKVCFLDSPLISSSLCSICPKSLIFVLDGTEADGIFSSSTVAAFIMFVINRMQKIHLQHQIQRHLFLYLPFMVCRSQHYTRRLRRSSFKQVSS